MNILIVKLSAIGDVIHVLPSLAALRRCYPDADITWVVEEAAADILNDHPDLNRVIVSGRKRWVKELKRGGIARPFMEMHAFWMALRSRKYDLVIDFHGLFKSAMVVFLSGGKRKLGYDSLQEGSGLFYTDKIPEDMKKHAVDRYLDFVSYLVGGAGKECVMKTPEFRIAVGENEERKIDGLLFKRPFVAMNPVALWDTKLWEDDKFAQLGDLIRTNLDYDVVLTGGEAKSLEKICSLMKTEALNLGGRTSLRELAALYKKAVMVITTDSGPMHLAAAVGTPVVALFGPTDPARTGPYGLGHRVIRTGISCSPCLRKKCPSPCCMKEISVADVYEAVQETVDKKRKK